MPPRQRGPRADPPQFLVAGHAVQDLLTPEEDGPWRLGGTVAYASHLARSLGLRTAVLTAAAPDLPLDELLPAIESRVVPSPKTTRIRNVYSDGHRHQYMPRRAVSLTAEHLPQEWRQTPIVLLGPVAAEIDASLAGCFPGSLLGACAQGWLREIAADTRVRPVPPARWQAAPILRHAGALFVSDEDLLPEETAAALQEWSAQVETLAFTRGERGAEVRHGGAWRHIGAFPARAVDLTGAGDVFAAGFLIRLWECGDVWEATRFASCAASFVVEGEGTSAIPDRGQIEARLREHPQIVCR
ncbi:MAG: ribokinase [Chloroflexi bacterium]|nr:ribokinase [Chloroflexota bacterium]